MPMKSKFLRSLSLIIIATFITPFSCKAKLERTLIFLQRHLKGPRIPTMTQALQLMEERNAKVIVETGTSRFGYKALRSDGGFTIIAGHWCAVNKAQLYSVDINPLALENIKQVIGLLSNNIKIVWCDSVEFLKKFNQPIDFLYLDSFDFEEKNPVPSQEHHLREIQVAYDKLHPNSVVMIDDCDLPHGGKGKLVIDYLLKKGWEIIADSYQVILVYPGNELN